jgi:hypothetical protein
MNSRCKKTQTSKRHHDGLKDVIGKLIARLKEYIEKFKELSADRKLIVILNKLLQIATAIYGLKNAKELPSLLKSLKYWGDAIDREKERNPEFSPSVDNIYFKRKQEVIRRSIKVLLSLISVATSNRIENNILNKQDSKGEIMNVKHYIDREVRRQVRSAMVANRRRKSGRHSDAQLIRSVRRINDGALESLVQKLKAATEKAIEWCKQKKQEYPNAAKLLILLLKINGWCGLVLRGGSAAILGVASIAAPKEYMSGVKQYINEFGPIKYVLAVIIALLKDISSLIAAKKLEEL